MRKKFEYLIFCMGVLSLLTGCASATHVSLGDRAIVKTVYLDEKAGEISAALVVFTCDASTQAASVEGQARIYTGRGSSIEQAVLHAEQQQNKKPFYAQNEMLLLGPGAVKAGVSPFVAYFTREDSAGSNMSVFLTAQNVDEFAACEEVIGDVVREGERVTASGTGAVNKARSVYEIKFSKDGKLSGYLPVLQFEAAEGTFAQINRLILFESGLPVLAMHDEMMQMALLLSGKANKLTLNLKMGGEDIFLQTQQLYLTREVQKNGELLQLNEKLIGGVEAITVEGMPVPESEKKRVISAVNAELESVAAALLAQTFARGNDVFEYTWWLQMQSVEKVRDMRKNNTLYTRDTVAFESGLKII